jgi:6-phosphogluconolactonase
VFSIDQATGEPKLIQNASCRWRCATAAASGRCPAAMVVYRIGEDGRLTFARKYDVDTGKVMQFWSGMVG